MNILEIILAYLLLFLIYITPLIIISFVILSTHYPSHKEDPQEAAKRYMKARKYFGQVMKKTF